MTALSNFLRSDPVTMMTSFLCCGTAASNLANRAEAIPAARAGQGRRDSTGLLEIYETPTSIYESRMGGFQSAGVIRLEWLISKKEPSW
jgi:hypothetical protein